MLNIVQRGFSSVRVHQRTNCKEPKSEEPPVQRDMSKKNNLSLRKKQHEFELRREQQEKEKKIKKLQAKKNKMKVDGKGKKKKSGGFTVGKKKLKTRMTPLAKAKAAQAMEVDQ